MTQSTTTTVAAPAPTTLETVQDYVRANCKKMGGVLAAVLLMTFPLGLVGLAYTGTFTWGAAAALGLAWLATAAAVNYMVTTFSYILIENVNWALRFSAVFAMCIGLTYAMLYEPRTWPAMVTAMLTLLSIDWACREIKKISVAEYEKDLLTRVDKQIDAKVAAIDEVLQAKVAGHTDNRLNEIWEMQERAEKDANQVLGGETPKENDRGNQDRSDPDADRGGRNDQRSRRGRDRQ